MQCCSTIDTLDIVRLDLSLSMCLMSPLNFTSSRNVKKRHVVFMASCSGVHRGTGSWNVYHASLRQYVLHSLRLGVLGVTEIAPSLNIGCVDWHRWLEDIRKWFYGYQTKSHPITKNIAWDFAASPTWHHRAWTQIKLEAFLPKAVIEMVVFLMDGKESHNCCCIAGVLNYLKLIVTTFRIVRETERVFFLVIISL